MKFDMEIWYRNRNWQRVDEQLSKNCDGQEVAVSGGGGGGGGGMVIRTVTVMIDAMS